MVSLLTIPTPGQGLHLITDHIADVVTTAARSGALAEDHTGLCTIFLRHTSASLLIQENADPSARHDLERWFNRLVPESGPGAAEFTHTSEGPDDMPSHIRMALTRTSETIPVSAGRMMLGTWQGLYLFEHRRAAHRRQVMVTISGERWED